MNHEDAPFTKKEKNPMKGYIADIKRFAVHDGPGIRTTVFLKGCALRCLWCHNPETISPKPEVGYAAQKCVHCGRCAQVCPQGLHTLLEGKHEFLREGCAGCGQCAQVCPRAALTFYGREMTVPEVLEQVMEDRGFYRETGGGITVSGGEPLLQAEFCAQLLRQAKAGEIGTAVDTCGAVPWAAFERALPHTDLFLYDIKHMDTRLHQRYTGAGNELPLSNLVRLTQSGASVEIRIPLIPGYNDSGDHLNAVGRFLGGLSGITKVRILPYHRLARSKYADLAKPDTLPDVPPPSNEKLREAAGRLRLFELDARSGRE